MVPIPDEGNQELIALRQRVAELEQQLTACQQAYDIEKKYHDAQRLLQNIIDNLPQAIFWKDTNSIFCGCNKRFARDSGVESTEDIVGKDDNDLSWTPEQATFFRQIDQRVMETNTPEYHIVEPKLHVSDTQSWLDICRIPLQDAEENTVGILVTYEDITEHRKIGEMLRASEERFRSLVETISVATFIVRGTQFHYVNPATEKLLGRTREELTSLPYFWDVVHPDYREMVQQNAIARQRGETAPSRYEIKFIHPDGSVRWADLSAEFISFDGKPSVLATAFDITDRMNVENALRASEERFRTLFESTAITTIIIQGTKLRYVNPAGEKLLGYTNADLPTIEFWDIFHPEFQEVVKERGLARQRGEHIIPRYEAKIRTRSGQERWVDITSNPIELEGKPAILATLFDINERKQFEEEQARLRERVIKAQEEALLSLSTPLIPVADNVIVMPLIGTIDHARAQQVMDTLLQGVADNHADIAILDITGVPMIDSHVADALIRAAMAVRLLGTQVILTGIGPSMAETLVHLGTDLSNIVTLSTLQNGIAYALK